MSAAQFSSYLMTYRLANDSDCKDIYEWENDIVTRAQSVNTALFSYASHIEWYKNSLLNNKRFLYIALNNNRRFAFIRFDHVHQGVYESSIILNPIIRGKGLSSQILNGSIDLFLKHHNTVSIIKASIKNTNLSSRKCFLKSGFIFQRKNDEYSLYDLIVNPTKKSDLPP